MCGRAGKVLGDRFVLKQIGDAEDLESWLTRSAKKGGYDRRSPLMLASAPEYCPIHLFEVKRMMWERCAQPYFAAFCAKDPPPWGVHSPSLTEPPAAEPDNLPRDLVDTTPGSSSLTVPPGIDDVVREERPSLLSRLCSKFFSRSSRGDEDEHSIKPSDFIENPMMKSGSGGHVELTVVPKKKDGAATTLSSRQRSSDANDAATLNNKLSTSSTSSGDLPLPTRPQRTALPAGWDELTTGEGRAYYINRTTKETTWTLP